MSYNCNLYGKEIISVSECADIVTKHVEQIDNYSSKFKAIYLMYNLGNDRYDFINDVFFFAPTPKTIADSDNCSEITLNMPIMKVYKTQIPGILSPGRYDLMKIIIKDDCEYVRNGETVQDSQYEIPFVLE